jgi:4-hydroxybenzoate polyprenyltransferase
VTAATRSPARAWLDLARAGNFPSVWSNVLAALVLSAPPGSTPWPPLAVWLLATLAATLVYAGGATLNDVADEEFDRRHKADRAIPSGAVSRQTATVLAALELGAGLAIFVFVLGASAPWALSLVAVIVAYDWLHKRWAGSVVLMAGCRALLGLTVASVPGHAFTPALLAWIAVLFTYIVVVSVLARAEYAPGAPAAILGRWVGRLLAFIPLVDAAVLLVAGAWPTAIVCAAAIPLGRGAQRLAAST